MKRYTSLILIICILFSLCACKRKMTDDIVIIDDVGNSAAADSEIGEADTMSHYDPTKDYSIIEYIEEEPQSDSHGQGISESNENYQPTNQEVLDYFEKIHPGCTVTVDHNGDYTVSNKNLSIEEYKTDKLLQRQTDDGWTRESVENWLEADCLEYTVIFKGKKTGNSINFAQYTAWKLPAVPYGAYTITEMEVTEAYYGNIKKGDKIWVSDSYGIVCEDGEYRLDISNYALTNGMFADEYVLHATKVYSNYHDIPNEYTLDFFALPLDREYQPQDTLPGPGFDYVVYEKYILNKDIALNKYKEIEKQLRKNKDIVLGIEDLASCNVPMYPDSYDIANDIKSANYTITDRQTEMINDALERYGEK